MTVLELEKIHKSYIQGGSKIEVLKGIDFVVEQGELIAIRGQSGSGKSTLLAILAGIDRPDSGVIKISNTNLAGMSESDLTRFRGHRIGIVFQQFHLVPHLTAIENVMLPLEIAKDKKALVKARECLASVGLGHRENHFPSQLSGGECQRVAIARAFITDPQLLLADEPSGNLDPDTGFMVMNLLFDQVKNRRMTLIVVTHSAELAAKCQRSFQLKDGILRESVL